MVTIAVRLCQFRGLLATDITVIWVIAPMRRPVINFVEGALNLVGARRGTSWDGLVVGLVRV